MGYVFTERRRSVVFSINNIRDHRPPPCPSSVVFSTRYLSFQSPKCSLQFLAFFLIGRIRRSFIIRPVFPLIR
ncbi:unnamed protein product [Lactuca virosa]|uniref:Uncharacterized protein n=1 Tax=Lactuca virosa TaxID=75947 RepID=A0AAU9LHB9_9ASTR|nr:unnamed protein product [Lactuca virosa]